MKKVVVLLCLSSVLLMGCPGKKDNPALTTGTVNFTFTHAVDQEPLVFNELIYHNKAGNNFKVYTLKYYVSKLILHKDNGDQYDVNMYKYVDFNDPLTYEYALKDIPNGTYTKISMVFGIDSARNYDGGIDITDQNNNMFWNFGGYHFMMMEGAYLDTLGHSKIFLLHLGGNPNQAKLQFTGLHLNVNSNTQPCEVHMNVNGWFNGINTIDLNDDYSAIMENPAKQQLFSQNAQSVFSIVHHH